MHLAHLVEVVRGLAFTFLFVAWSVLWAGKCVPTHGRQRTTVGFLREAEAAFSMRFYCRGVGSLVICSLAVVSIPHVCLPAPAYRSS